MAHGRFDIVLFGATGFTGRLAALYLAAKAPLDLSWAIAGRNKEKLEAVLREIIATNSHWEGRVPVLVADVAGSEQALVDVASQAKVVLTTVGPFARHGEPLVRACATAGTDYVDSTGEVTWVAAMAAKYGRAAKASGATLVSMSGFDSVPADLGTLLLVEHARTKLGGVKLAGVTAYVSAKAGVSGGTLASTFNAFDDPTAAKGLFNPYVLVETVPGVTTPSAIVAPARPSFIPFFAEDVKKWAHFFFMSPINTNVVRKSAALHAVAKAAYSAGPFTYTEYSATSSALVAVFTTLALAVFAALARVSVIRSVLRRVVPQPGEGPTEAQRKASHFTYTLVGRTEEPVSRRIVGVMSGGDPGYDETAKMLAEAALALARQKRELPAGRFGGGFLTPATALGMPYVERLNAAGLRLVITESPAGTK